MSDSDKDDGSQGPPGNYRYTPEEDVHRLIKRFIQSMRRGADVLDDDRRNPKSADRYVNDIRWYNDWLDEQNLDPETVTKADAEILGEDLSNQFNGTTPKNRWRIIHEFHQYLVKLDIRDTNPLAVWDDDIKQEFGMSSTPEQEKHMEDGERYAVTKEEVRLMEQHVTKEPIRDSLLIRLLWQTGMRKGEAVGIKLDHINEEDHEITIPAANAKNDQRRVVAYQPTLDGLLQKWLYDGYRTRFAVAEDSDYLFLTRRAEQMSTDAVEDIVVDAACEAGINRVLYTDANDGKRWKITPHSLRHGFGNYMIDTDATLFEVSKAMGHASVKVTQDRYLDHDPEAGVGSMHKYGPE